jgi:DNA-binding MarR family transcriptional regulator
MTAEDDFAPDDHDDLLGLLHEALTALVRRGGYDLTARQFALLLIVYSEDGPHTISGLAARLATPRSVAAHSLDVLEGAGLVARMRDPDDRRSALVCRTETDLDYVMMIAAAMTASARR